ncbi:MAG: glycosyltransferase family protein [bacterium]
MKIITIIQARFGSSRLPGKTILSLCGKPLLLRMIERVKKSENKGKIIIATTTTKNDDIIEDLCKEEDIICFRGNEIDLLDRHYKAAQIYKADAVVKIPSDCPLIDPQIIDKVIKRYIDDYPFFDYVSNLHPPSYPDGNDVEIMSYDALEKAWLCAEKDYEREHTTPYIWDNPEKFKIGNVKWGKNRDYSKTHRWTIDYEEDYVFIRKIYEELYLQNTNFSIYDILNLLYDKPYLRQINAKYLGKYWYDNNITELKNINFYKRNIIKNV